MKKQRIEHIKEIISTKQIKSQEELLDELNNVGFKLTQATLSRDLKKLKVIKEPHEDGNYYYTLSSSVKLINEHGVKDFLPNEVKIGFSANTAVVKTRAGYATSIASEIDHSMSHELLGCVAGDDTIILIAKENIERELIIEGLKRIVKVVEIQ